jgi:peptidoglycan/xylan/chitin deacetylase (PgdA/CDA1 family)
MMKNLAKQAVLRGGGLRLLGQLRGSGVAVLMYHSVLKRPEMVNDTLGGIVHSTEVFRGQMEMLAKEFHAATLDDVLRFVRGEKPLPKRSVVVTFDDGYVDNLEIAVPILNQVGVPATFYVTVDCVERDILPWPSRLRYAFRKTGIAGWQSALGKVWPLDTAEARETAYLFACDCCCKLAGNEQEQFVENVENALTARAPRNTDARMMNWEQVRAVVKSGHIVGSHTMTHPNMAQVNAEAARNELHESKRQLESQLGVKVPHFSYPCPALTPHWNQRTLEECRRAGYETAVTTDGGLARAKDDPLRLKRIRPSKTVDGFRWNLECAFAGRVV